MTSRHFDPISSNACVIGHTEKWSSSPVSDSWEFGGISEHLCVKSYHTQPQKRITRQHGEASDILSRRLRHSPHLFHRCVVICHMNGPESHIPESPLELAAGAAEPHVTEAFKLLSDEIRLAILLALWEVYDPRAENNAISFSQLFDRVG